MRRFSHITPRLSESWVLSSRSGWKEDTCHLGVNGNVTYAMEDDNNPYEHWMTYTNNGISGFLEMEVIYGSYQKVLGKLGSVLQYAWQRLLPNMCAASINKSVKFINFIKFQVTKVHLISPNFIKFHITWFNICVDVIQKKKTTSTTPAVSPSFNLKDVGFQTASTWDCWSAGRGGRTGTSRGSWERKNTENPTKQTSYPPEVY